MFRIRMDPGFFADPDPSINKLMGSEWCFWLGFGGTWPKRTVLTVESAKYEKTFLGFAIDLVVKQCGGYKYMGYFVGFRYESKLAAVKIRPNLDPAPYQKG